MASSRQASVTPPRIALAESAPASEELPERTGTLAGLGGRFISRGRLSVRALQWLAWLATSRRAAATSSVTREGEAIGLDALQLVGTSSVLVGLIATFQIASQLAEYSAGAMSPMAIGWFAARELGPLGVALLVVARSAPAIAGELASMNANGEIDALRAMGLDPVKYLVAPKLAALLITLPALTVLADGLIVLGAWVGHTFFLQMNTTFFFEQFRSGFALRDVFVGLGKSLGFAFVIGIFAADSGLSGGRRVAAIGEAATRAVVYCVLGVLAADTLVNVVVYFIPGLA
jgi:phospholipid/cholesterol/gamma-HCH transport system permease protein